MVETTPGQSQKLFETPATANQTEESKAGNKDSFLGSLLVFCQWSCGKQLLDETTIKYTETRALTAIQTGCLGALHRSHSLTALNSGVCWYSMKNIIWNVLKVMISRRK